MKDKALQFVLSLVVLVVGSCLLASLRQREDLQEQLTQFKNKAIELEYAEWQVSMDKHNHPVVEFQWIIPDK